MSARRIAGVVLAGGEGSRMGGVDKGLVPFRQVPMVSWLLQPVRSEVDRLMISCNRNLEHYSALGVELVTDLAGQGEGPLAGIQAAMHALDDRFSHLLVLPCDTPLINPRLVGLLLRSARLAPEHIIYLQTGSRQHFLHAVIPLTFRESLDRWLHLGQRGVGRWYRQLPARALDVSEQTAGLLNMNTPAELSQGA